MKKPFSKFALIFISFVILVGLACSLTGGGDPTATPLEAAVQAEQPVDNPPAVEEPQEQPPQQQPEPTLAPTFTEAVAPTQELITEEPVDESLAFFMEEFDGDIDDWSYFLMNGSETNMDIYTENDALVFDLQGEDQWVYVIYDPYYYSEVMIEVLAENKGMNSNNVSLICNYTDQYGWYEFNITNGGLYDILAYDELEGEYRTLASGGSTHIVTGRNSNIYTAVCIGNYLELYINGYLEKEHTDNIYNFREGHVGVSVSSFDVLPILVEIEYFYIGEPY